MISLKTKIIYVLHLNSECDYKLNEMSFYMIVHQFLPNISNYDEFINSFVKLDPHF